MKVSLLLISCLSSFFFAACSNESSDAVIDEVPQVNVKTIATGYEIIWGMDFLPGGELIFGERRGKLYRKNNETVTEITGLPTVLSMGQGGLLDIKVHPNYSDNGWVYACFAAAKSGGGAQLLLIRFRISNNQVQNIDTVFATNGSNTWYGHYGSRIAFDKSNYLYLSVGEGGTGSYGGTNAVNHNASDPKSDWGKIHRLTDNGTVPADNPVFPGSNTPTSVYSLGHRNPQGLTVHRSTGAIWASEHGPKGGDEVNIIVKGANFGWPAYSIGVNYDGSTISTGHTAQGITSPVYTWTPSIGICGITFIYGNKFKAWKNNLLVCGLASQKIYRCVVSGNRIIEVNDMLSGFGRVRTVIQAPDESIYVSVENPGRIVQIIPE